MEVGAPGGRAGPPEAGERSGCRQLDRQRQPLQAAAHLRNYGPILFREGEVGLRCARPRHEEADGFYGFQARYGALSWCWEGEWWHREGLLPRDLQPYAAGDEHGEPGTGGQERGHQRSGLDHLLKVVQDEQEVTVLQGDSKEVGQWLVTSGTHPQNPSECREDEVGVSDRGEGNQDHPIGKAACQFFGHPQGEPRLADTPRTGQGDQPHSILSEQGGDDLHLPRPTNEGGQ